jgi:hypothetical protein
MRVFVQSTLPCDADRAWAEVMSRLLREICWPLIVLRPAAGEAAIAERWQGGVTNRLRPTMFGVIPLGTRVRHWESIDPDRREMQTREYDPVIRRWDHRIQVEPLTPGKVDIQTTEIDAGC